MKQTGKERFPTMFSEGKIGKFKTKNKIKYAACSVSNFNTMDGFVTEREFARSEIIARTGAAVLTNQGVYPDEKGEGKTYWRQLSLADDRYIPGLERLATMFRRENPEAVLIQQILHGGRYGGIHLDYCLQPSAVDQTLLHFRLPREMTKEDIHKCIEDHAEVSRRSVRAGYDGIEVTGFLGYLLSAFCSKFTNRRTDEYGGTLEKRCRFMVELVAAIRKAIGPQLVVGVRLNGTELMDEYGGNTEEECREVMKIAESAGVDYISMVIGWHEARHAFLGRHMGPEHWLYLAEEAKKVINVPLAFGPGFRNPILAEKALKEGVIDFWEMCRPMLADPELIHKVWRNELEEIRPCIDSLDCISRMFVNQPYFCCVNPQLGHEVEPEYHSKPAARLKKVLVVGAGPAGIECALAAAKRGHEVFLRDRKKWIGGQMHYGALDEWGGEKLTGLIEYYERQLTKGGIDIELGIEVDRKVCRQIAPEVVVLATGVQMRRPEIPGINGDNVRTLFEVFEDGEIKGDQVVVWGGGKAGMCIARSIAGLDKKVTIVEGHSRVDFDVNRAWSWRLRQWLQQLNVEVILAAKIAAISEGRVTVVTESGEESQLPADHVVLAVREPDQTLYSSLETECDELYLIGDSVRARHISTAIHEGFKLGNRI